ncbi:ricin B lectin domain-containing protein [Mycena epipterygia]|nr:ricin B lectin domain-containing protein [Mycena epipterygia]
MSINLSALFTLLLASGVWGNIIPEIRAAAAPISNQYFHPIVNSRKCLTAGSPTNGAPVEIEDCAFTGATSQSWTLSGSTLQIFDNFCLDVTNGATADGTRLQVWECTEGDTNQQWTVSGNTIKWNKESSCLDLTNGNLTDGNVMQIWSCTDGPNQQWTSTTGVGLIPTPNLHPALGDLTCLTAPTNANGGPVVVEPCDGSTSQSWTQNGQTIVVYGNMCLDVTNGNTANGVKMQIWECNPSDGGVNQLFIYNDDSNIVWTDGGSLEKCFDLTDGSLAPGNPVQMWDCVTGDLNQLWNFGPA